MLSAAKRKSIIGIFDSKRVIYRLAFHPSYLFLH